MAITRRELLVAGAAFGEIVLEFIDKGPLSQLSKYLSSRTPQNTSPDEVARYGGLITLPSHGTVYAASDFHGRYGDYEQWISETGVKDEIADGKDVYAIILGDVADIKPGDKYADKKGDINILKEIREIQNSENGERFVLLQGNHELEATKIYDWIIASMRDVGIRNKDGAVNKNILQTLENGHNGDIYKQFNIIGRLNGEIAKYLRGLPVAALTQNGAVFAHAGPSKTATSPNDIAEKKPEVVKELLWSRPEPVDTLSGYTIETVRDFLNAMNGSKILITGHTPLNMMPSVFVNDENLRSFWRPDNSRNQIILATSYGSRNERRGSYLKMGLNRTIEDAMSIIQRDDIRIIDYSQDEDTRL